MGHGNGVYVVDGQCWAPQTYYTLRRIDRLRDCAVLC